MGWLSVVGGIGILLLPAIAFWLLTRHRGMFGYCPRCGREFNWTERRMFFQLGDIPLLKDTPPVNCPRCGSSEVVAGRRPEGWKGEG